MADNQYIRDGNVICGKSVAGALRQEITARVGELQAKHGKVRAQVMDDGQNSPLGARGAASHCRSSRRPAQSALCAAPLLAPLATAFPHSRPRPTQVPGLAVVIVGDRKDSQTYVRMKRKACEEVGFRSFHCDLPGDATQAAVLAQVAKFNADPAVHGILVQLPVRA